MHICLHVDRSRIFRWHAWLAEAVAALPGHEISRSFAAQSHPLPLGVHLLLDIERTIYRLDQDGATEPADAAILSLAPQSGIVPDVVVDFSGDGVPPAGRRVLTPLFNGIPGEIGIMTALTERREVLVELHDTACPQRPWTAHPASQDHEVFAATLDGALSCTVALILKAMRDKRGGAAYAVTGLAAGRSRFGTLRSLAWASSAVAAKALRLLDILVKGGNAWQIGWRFDGGASLFDCGDAAFRLLSGGVSSYLADPFPFQHQGRRFMFVEQYLYSKKKGCIAVVPMDRHGVAGPPEIVIEEPHHLSYPMVFEQAGQIWMIPEAGASGKVTLYRAEDYPYRWKREADLATDVQHYDVTPLPDAAGIWFFAAQRLWQSSSWDVLNIYRADSLTGKWTPHSAGPVLLDAALSRPAGNFIRRGGQILRPVQDCARGYGRAVTFCRIDELDAWHFAQTVIGRLRAGPYGCHTYNRRDGIEVVDLFGRAVGSDEAMISYVPLPVAEPFGRRPASSFRAMPPTGLAAPV